MREYILQVIQALHQHRELVADAYVQNKGLAPTEQTAAGLARLLKVKALTPYVENTWRLDRRLRVYFDRAVNRVKVYGNSTHYAGVVSKIAGLTELYEQAVLSADAAAQDERLDEIVDLCDEFATGMREDIEHFRMVVDTRKGFMGGSLTEKLTHNRNYVEQANQMVEAVGLLDQANLLDRIEGFADLTEVLQRHLYERVEGADDVRRRLFEVQSQLNKLLFDLNAAHRITAMLLRLDAGINRHADFELPDWDDEQLPAAAYRSKGFALPAYIDSREEPAETLLPLLAGIDDERRPQARAPVLKAGTLDDAGAPGLQRPSPSQLHGAITQLFSDALQGGQPVSIVAWLRLRTDREQLYPYPLAIWLGSLANAAANGLQAPAGWHFTYQAAHADARWETPVLGDICLARFDSGIARGAEPDAASAATSGAPANATPDAASIRDHPLLPA